MKLKYQLAKLMQKHPYSWFFAWSLINKFTFLLPHDKSYFALKYFCEEPGNQLFLDIGANCGISALSFRKINKRIPILSIEPNILHGKRLEKLSKRLQPFDYLLKGVGDKEAEITFFTPIYRGILLHTFTSFDKRQALEAISKSFGSKVANQLTIHESISHIVCVDQLNLKPSIIKIDTEGSDYNVLLGAQKTIEAERPFLMVEIRHADIEFFNGFFKSVGFEMFHYNYEMDIFSPCHVGSFSYPNDSKNIFAVPNEKIASLPVMR